MNEVIEIKVLDLFNIRLKFKDGTEAVIDFKPFIGRWNGDICGMYQQFKCQITNE